jgi:uncharacterized protein with HEPN domain
MKGKDPNVFLAHARDCLVRIADYAAEGEAVFLRERKTQDAIYRNLEIVGQCIKDAGIADLRSHYPEVDWRTIADFRNVLAHSYQSIKPEMVWAIIEIESPRLLNTLNSILENWQP